MFLSLLIFGICVILIGIMGTYGAAKARACFIVIFLIFVIIFTLIFLGFLAGYVYGNDYIGKNFNNC